MILNILYCILLKVWENKVSLEFGFVLIESWFFVLLGVSSKIPKHGQKCTFYK